VSEPWVTHDHIHEPPPKRQVKTDRVMVAVVMVGIAFGALQLLVKEAVINTAGRLKRNKRP